uniref:ATP synthase complex subunit 8 n=1 Tax=Conanalus pieli TaxID=948347 RepID=A0A1Q1MPG1_9ORTH|nr:ATP synthase F0 subunit 8 [Conanalus pieli]AQM39970.1 ATP synthase F0 subunit 8 [Conanalus pieli]
MPQMAPMSWLFLFLLFSFTLILFTMMKFPMITMKTETSPIIKTTLLTLNWKW